MWEQKNEKPSNETATILKFTSSKLPHPGRKPRKRRFSVQRADLCGSKTGQFPLMWDSSCSSDSPPAVRTLNRSDIYADKKNTQLSLPASAFSIPERLFYSPSLASRQPLCFTITRRDAGSLQRKVKYIIDFLSLSLSLRFSTSPRLSAPSSSLWFWRERLGASLSDPSQGSFIFPTKL